MAEDLTPGSPLWWVRRLEKKLIERQKRIALYDDYYEGEHRMAFATTKWKNAFGEVFGEVRDNWCDLVVDAVEERLTVQGFRFGSDMAADSKAWDIWQANNMDAGSQLAHQEALINETSYVLVWYGGDYPEITVEHPTQMIVEYESGSRTKRAAALKLWTDDDGFRLATLYLPDGLYKFRSKTKRSIGSLGATQYVERPHVDETVVKNPLGLVPVVPVHNRPRLIKPPQSEIKQVVSIQDGINKLLADMLVASEFGAARQRWATGLEVPIDPETGQPIAVFKPLVEAILTSADKDTKFGTFDATDLENFVKAIQVLVQHMASRTRTPPHYFYLSGQFPSGESIKSAETGLVAKARRRMIHFGEGWEEAMRIAFLIHGDRRRALIRNTETIWADPESRSESEHTDAVMKKRALGVPLQQCWADLGYSPQQIERFMEQLREEAAMGIVPGQPGPTLPPPPDEPVEEAA